jgi:sugar (pentulose or hexulose) kinase
MGADILVGVDVGTTSLKAVAVSLAGQVLASASRPTPWRRNGAHADIDPRELADVTIAVCAEAAADERLGSPGEHVVRGIGVTGIAETGALLDSAGNPCAPALAWFDPRGDVQALRDRIDRTEFQRATGVRLNSKPSIAKIMWLQRNIPGADRAVRHLCVGEWIVRALGGDEVTESSLASRTGLFDVHERTTWQTATDIVGPLMPERHVWAGERVGTASGDVPQALRGAALTVAGHDHQTASLIVGACRDGALFDSMGTAEALIRTVARTLTRDEMQRLTDLDISVGWGVLPGHQILLAGRVTGLSLERVSSLLGATDRASRLELGVQALKTERGAMSPRIEQVDNESLSITGITDGVTPGLMWRVAVEDLTRIVDEPLGQMDEAVGPRLSSVVAGGWIHNAMVADAKQRQLGGYRVSELEEPGALGAAFLGGVAAGLLRRPDSGGVAHWLD